MTIYILRGECGEYSDWSAWVVRAYRSKDEAEAVAAKANGLCNAYYATRQRYDYQRAELIVALNGIDPDPQTDYTGTHYSVIATELVGEAAS